MFLRSAVLFFAGSENEAPVDLWSKKFWIFEIARSVGIFLLIFSFFETSFFKIRINTKVLSIIWYHFAEIFVFDVLANCLAIISEYL